MVQDDQENESVAIKRKSTIAFAVCILFLLAYFFLEKREFIVDKTVLILLFVGLGFLFIPNVIRLIKRLKISSVEIELTSVEARTLRGEVVQDEDGRYFYIAKDGASFFALPDSDTANLLRSYKGILRITKDKLKNFGLISEMESAKKAPILRSKRYGHVFVILNREKFYISSYGPIIDMRREDEIGDVEEEELRKYRTER